MMIFVPSFRYLWIAGTSPAMTRGMEFAVEAQKLVGISLEGSVG